MENTPVNVNFGEAPIKEPDSKEKSKGKKAKTFSQKLGVEAILSNVLSRGGEEKPRKNPLRRKPKAKNAPQPTKLETSESLAQQSSQVETKKTGEKNVAKAPLGTESKFAEEAKLKPDEKSDSEPVLEADQVKAEIPTIDETKTEVKDAEKPEVTDKPGEESHVEEESDIPFLPNADDAWDSINPPKLTVEGGQISTADKLEEEVERPGKQPDKTPNKAVEEYPVRDLELVEAETALKFSDSLVADGNIHELPQIESAAYQHLEPESETLIIEHELESADFDYEIQEYTKTDLQFIPGISEQTTSSPAVEAEYAYAGGGNNEPPLPLEYFEQPAEVPEPDRAALTAENSQTQASYRERIRERAKVVPIEAILASEEATSVTAAPETQIVEKRERASSRSRSDKVLGWVGQKRLEREVHRSHRQQKKQIKEFAHQEKKSDEKLHRQLVEQKTMSSRHQSKLSKQIEKMTNLISRPNREADTPRPRIRYHVVERERELIRERQSARLQKQAMQEAEQVTRQTPTLVERPTSPLATFDLLPKLEEAQYQDEVEAAPEEPAGALNLTQILEAAGYSEPARVAIERQLNSQTRLEVADALKPIVGAEKAAELKKEEVLVPIKSAVAETAVERVLHIPPEHRLQKSAWHSIEVDKSGRAVENPVFAYGHEFMQEQRQEARSYKAPLTAMQTGLLAIRDASNAVSMSFSPQLTPQAATVPQMPAISIEDTVREPKQPRGLPMNLEENIGLLVAVAIVLLSIVGLLLAH